MAFQRIVCGVDGSLEGFEALQQARSLLAPGGRLVAVTACEDHLAVHTGLHAPRVAAELRAEADRTRAKAEEILHGLDDAEALVARGRPVEVLRRAVEREEADLLALGSHGAGRTVGLLLGSVATAMLHDAPCSVLLARRAAVPGPFPQRVVVGIDGSAGSAAAEVVATSLGGRVGSTVRSVAARAALTELEAASDTADLLVVGSRGLRGIAALGSVSRRIAHRARCSVLVVRQALTTTKTTKAAYSEAHPRIAAGPKRRRRAITK